MRCEALQKILKEKCPNQTPQHPTYDADEGLWLVKNIARSRRPIFWQSQPVVKELTECLVPTPQLREVVDRSEDARCLIVEGLAGQGKSCLAAALARPEISERKVPSA